MSKMTLVIGNKNYSSWSLRPWLFLKYFKVPFNEVLIPLYDGDFKKEVLQYSPNGKVPAIVHGKLQVWESLAIMEYVAEVYPNAKMWPGKIEDRAWARAISQEMHAGFGQLRTHMPMNIRASHPDKGRTPEVENDILRIVKIWTQCRESFLKKGPFLFGEFTIADAMFAPVVTRFRTYGVTLNGLAATYSKTILNLSEFKEWERAALKEEWFIKASEIYNPDYQ